MVRKRSRRYESDDNDSDSTDSDENFSFEEESGAPAPKKYSLRERKNNSSLVTDFTYYGLDDEEGDGKQTSDEDFEVDETADNVEAPPSATYFEPESNIDTSNADGLIDFEDIIRADIVVNKNKIDYDNLIHKTEIKLTEPDLKKSVGKRRGRKPKNQLQDAATDNSILEESHSNIKDEVLPEHTTDILEPEVDFSEGHNDLNSDELEIKNGIVDNSLDGNIPVAASEAAKVEEDEDDDDVIVLEEKHDVIVLDD